MLSLTNITQTTNFDGSTTNSNTENWLGGGVVSWFRYLCMLSSAIKAASGASNSKKQKPLCLCVPYSAIIWSSYVARESLDE